MGFFVSNMRPIISGSHKNSVKPLIISTMRQTFSCKCYCRQSKANKEGLSPVEVSIISNGKRVFLQTQYRCKASDFNRKRRPQEVDQYCNSITARVNTILLEMLQAGIPVTADAVKTYLKNGGYKSYQICDLFDEYLSIQKDRIGKTLTKPVYRKYELVRDLFYTVVDKTRDCSSIVNADVLRFFTLLDSKYDSSTACGYKTKCKSILTFGLNNNYIRNHNIFQGIKITKERKDVVYLTEDEIRTIIDTPIENKSLAAVRDAFVLQLSTGLAYADIAALKREDIHIADDGTHYIQKPRIKTGTTYTTLILPEGVEVLKRNGYQLHIISNQKYNIYLKSIQTLCGIEKNLTTHLARHSFAQLLLSRGVRLETVSKMLGHQNTKVTQTFYCQIRTNDVINEVKRVML